MRSILIIPGYRLYPMETGAGVAQFGIIDEMRKYFSVTLLIDENNVDSSSLSGLQERWPEVSWLQWAELKVNWEAAVSGSLWSRIKKKLVKDEVPIKAPDLKISKGLEEVWSNASILYYPTPEWRMASLRFHLEQNKYDLVQTDLPVNLPLIDRKLKGLSTVHVCHELKHKRFKNTAEAMKVEAPDYQMPFDALRAREVELIEAYDHCILFSEEDATAISPTSDIGIHVSPFPILDEEFSFTERDEATRMIFIGPESHGPNKEGLHWFLENILPQLDLTWSLHIIGRWTKETVAIWSATNVHFEGFVNDLQPYFQNSIMIVPIWTGAGIRTKILQAMAQKVPVLSTPFAAEGIPAEQGKEILYFRDKLTFNEGLAILSEVQGRKAIVERAQDLVRSRFSQAVLGKLRAKILNEML